MTRAIKVVHLIEGLGSGGAERLLYTNLTHLEEVESEVVTVFSGQDYWKEPIEELGIAITSLGCKSYRDIARGIVRFRRLLDDMRPDVIHTHLFAANVIGRVAGKLAGIPVISSVHNPEYETAAHDSVGKIGRLKITGAQIIDAISARIGCMRMIAVSEFVRQSASRKLRFSERWIDVIYNPLSGNGVETDRKSLLQELGVAESSRLLITVGRLSPQKGLIYAVRAMKEVVEHEPGVCLLSVGSQSNTDYKELVLNEIDANALSENVRLVGERSDIDDLLASCDVFVFPSLFEGLGIALAEAMAAGCACITSNIRPFDEFVVNGVNGILVPPGDPAALAGAILDLLGNDEKRVLLGEAARKTANRLFQPEPAAQKLRQVYVGVVRS